MEQSSQCSAVVSFAMTKVLHRCFIFLTLISWVLTFIRHFSQRFLSLFSLCLFKRICTPSSDMSVLEHMWHKCLELVFSVLYSSLDHLLSIIVGRWIVWVSTVLIIFIIHRCFDQRCVITILVWHERVVALTHKSTIMLWTLVIGWLLTRVIIWI